MTDNDWADEIARQLDNDSTCNNDVAAALRQAYQNGERRGRAMGWQTIDTAPKDGTQIMLFGRWLPYDISAGGGPCYLLVRWSTIHSNGTGYQWMTDALTSLGETLFPNLKTPGSADTWNVKWTHWQPLPDPPNTKGEKE